MKKWIYLLMAVPAVLIAPQLGAQSAGTDAEALSLLMAVNQQEVQAAENAISKNVQGQVRDYAGMMSKEHNKNLEKTTQLLQDMGVSPVDSPIVQQIKDNGSQEKKLLSALTAKEFERAYIMSMVKAHMQTIDAIDRLKGGLQNEEVQDHVQNTRQTIDEHLKEAKRIQTDLEPQSGM